MSSCTHSLDYVEDDLFFVYEYVWVHVSRDNFRDLYGVELSSVS